MFNQFDSFELSSVGEAKHELKITSTLHMPIYKQIRIGRVMHRGYIV